MAEKDINALNDARDKALNQLFGESATTQSPAKRVGNVGGVKNAASIQNEIFYVLEKYGYSREQVLPIVANLIENLNRVKTADTYKFKNM